MSYGWYWTLLPVYPRGCGGTLRILTYGALARGLSPRVRGNRDIFALRFRCRRSIPAGAGEPFLRGGSRSMTGVYPRGCGGTTSPVNRSQITMGLSPRVRGNRVVLKHVANDLGSIPAGAGEPVLWGVWGACYKVYPRGCGGTPPLCPTVLHGSGLSPRVRGNP